MSGFKVEIAKHTNSFTVELCPTPQSGAYSTPSEPLGGFDEPYF